MKRLAIPLAMFALLALAGGAAAASNPIVIGLGLSHSTADLATYGGGFSHAYDHSELGARFEYWNFLHESYALNFNANLGFFSETDKPGTAAPPGTPEGKYTQSSWSVRLGGDRVWSPNARTKLFMGPGIEFWTGKAKFKDIGGFAGTYETRNAERFSLHGHTGAQLMMGSGWGISGQLGHRIGVASYKERGANTTWWPSSLDGAMEFIFTFGGK